MAAPASRPFSGARFWRWYALAWLGLAAPYLVGFLVPGEASAARALAAATASVLPMAALGLLVLALFRRMDWTPEHRARFAVTHVALGLLFGVAVTSSSYGTFVLLHRFSATLF